MNKYFNSTREFYGERSNPEGINQYTVGGGSSKESLKKADAIVKAADAHHEAKQKAKAEKAAKHKMAVKAIKESKKPNAEEKAFADKLIAKYKAATGK